MGSNNNVVPKTDWRSIYIVNLVSGISSLQIGSIMPTIWPYMQIINPSLTVTMFGMVNGASSLANVIASGIAGVLANRFKQTKWLVIFGQILNITSMIIYLCIPLAGSAATWVFLGGNIVTGFSFGFCSTCRTFVATESNEQERSKAFGITMFALSIGSLLGPSLQLLFTLIKYPGVALLFGLYLNVYTAPVYFAIITTCVCTLILVFFFNGKLRVKQNQKLNEKVIENTDSVQYVGIDGYLTTHFGANTNDETNEIKKDTVSDVKIDKFAVFVLLVVKATVDINMLMITSLVPPYSMAAFEWSSATSVRYISGMTLAVGFASLFFSVGYVFFKFAERIPERVALIIALSIFFLFFLFTYPWAFYKTTIPYQHVPGQTAYYSQHAAMEALQSQNITHTQLVGCNINYAWCEKTPRINEYVYLVCLVFAIGISLPLMIVNLDILYSKMLGPMKQGVLQALFFGLAPFINIVGPFCFTEIYTISGPTFLWMFELAVSLMTLMLFTLNYNRMVSFTERVDLKLKKRKT